MRYEIRPLGHWDRPITNPRMSSARFSADWNSTLELLGHEVDMLDGTTVVVQVDVTEGELRRDGMLRANARVQFPGVKVSFTSKHGPLTYSSDAYEQLYGRDMPGWQANLRAVALGLQALRAVDRYGISASGEQYRGWTAIAARAGEFDMTPQQAAELLAADAPWSAADIVRSPQLATAAYRMAAKSHHPDIGGDAELFRRITAARDLLIGQKA